MKKRPLSKRARRRERALRRDPFGRLGLAIRDYLRRHGWSVIVVGNPEVRGDIRQRVGNYEFAVRFTGSRITLDSGTPEKAS